MDKYGTFQLARPLLDSGTEINFITEEMAKRLQLQFQRQQFEISGIANVQWSGLLNLLSPRQFHEDSQSTL